MGGYRHEATDPDAGLRALPAGHGRAIRGSFLQPDGILQDECQHHSAHLCFDHNHSHRFGASAYEHDRKLIANFSQQAREARRGMPGQEDLFLFAGESPYHWEIEQYHMGYLRTATSQHPPTKRYILPDRPLSTAIVGATIATCSTSA